MRTFTAGLAGAWAVLAIILSAAALISPEERLQAPFNDSRLGGVAVIERLHPSAAGSGLELGDRLLEVDGAPYQAFSFSGGRLVAPDASGRAITYLVEKRDGRRVTATAMPVPASEMRTRMGVAFHFLLLCVAIIYMVTAGIVWWVKPGRSGAWALVLFASTMAVQLATTLHADSILWADMRVAVNVPLMGASIFHLFTTYPLEPAWVVRHHRVHTVPYAAAVALIALVLLAEPLGFSPALPWALSFLFTVALSAASIAVLGVERRRHGAGPMKDAADVVFFSALLSFAPVLLILLLEWVLVTPLPYYLALLWVFVFPVAVGFGIARRQLFDVRNLAKSSAAYGAATLGITGAFALVITFADTLVTRFGVSERGAQLALLFVALLLFDPVRRRMQALVDRFFDRDRAAYRVAVREISEAMVSMLSLNEIADRILVALTDTMGVQRAVVLLADEEGRTLRPIASRGDWDDDGLVLDIPSTHPIWKHLWMRREDLTRIDFDEERDVETREQCRDIFDTLEVALLVPILYGVDLLGVIAVGRK
ncbi:MAG: hypothetical protein JRH16_08080, partial [Deltaproteobacteria bacterium]|nr:hypothetical protein [Deltaproteobacteria bacterium]